MDKFWCSIFDYILWFSRWGRAVSSDRWCARVSEVDGNGVVVMTTVDVVVEVVHNVIEVVGWWRCGGVATKGEGEWQQQYKRQRKTEKWKKSWGFVWVCIYLSKEYKPYDIFSPN